MMVLTELCLLHFNFISWTEGVCHYSVQSEIAEMITSHI